MGFFDKKYCDVCEEDRAFREQKVKYNMCKVVLALSPFTDRQTSLSKLKSIQHTGMKHKPVEAFNVTRSLEPKQSTT